MALNPNISLAAAAGAPQTAPMAERMGQMMQLKNASDQFKSQKAVDTAFSTTDNELDALEQLRTSNPRAFLATAPLVHQQRAQQLGEQNARIGVFESSLNTVRGISEQILGMDPELREQTWGIYRQSMVENGIDESLLPENYTDQILPQMTQGLAEIQELKDNIVIRTRQITQLDDNIATSKTEETRRVAEEARRAVQEDRDIAAAKHVESLWPNEIAISNDQVRIAEEGAALAERGVPSWFEEDWMAQNNTAVDNSTPDQRVKMREEYTASQTQPATTQSQLFVGPDGQIDLYNRNTRTGALTDRYGNPGSAELRPYVASAVSLEQTIPSDWLNVMERSLPNTASRRSAPIELMNRLYSEATVTGDFTELQEVIRKTTLDDLNVDMRNRVMGRQSAINSLEQLDALMTEMESEGVNMNIFSGTVEDVAEIFGKTTDPRLVRFEGRVMPALFEFRRSLTGVQFSVQESAQYEGLYPNYRTEAVVNHERIRGLMEGMRIDDDFFWKNELGDKGMALVGVGNSYNNGTTTGTGETASDIDAQIMEYLNADRNPAR
jgi:hypothetical protein